MEVSGYNFPDELYYDTNHFWARVEGDVVVMGTTDLTQRLAGEITFVDVPEEDDEVTQGKPFGSIESGKWVGRVYAVVSGEVAEGNEELEDEPELINSDCYGEGWICKITPGDLEGDLSKLMQGEAYAKWVEAEIAKLDQDQG
ncbi:MAG: glycine cleavage system protein GcvH [Desulfarculaceae bacterium]|nr:glycine cleavage system protein GcvH [Desulfarculaceae bacterium]MCF8073901.1 glycine cleavage system protein GcvH [Desulfarculaceae bacterium]MCF8102054.1 glycine cleavage system protein GcvH [Desulfarculaceae bacterium]MCF8116325.1 glycine cleavage system protein GcvH [Desulfarculaceae bacterium]